MATPRGERQGRDGLTADEVAKSFGVSPRTVKLWGRTGKLKKTGGRYDAAEVERLTEPKNERKQK